jgi:hypothetical protein
MILISQETLNCVSSNEIFSCQDAFFNRLLILILFPQIHNNNNVSTVNKEESEMNELDRPLRSSKFPKTIQVKSSPKLLSYSFIKLIKTCLAAMDFH